MFGPFTFGHGIAHPQSGWRYTRTSLGRFGRGQVPEHSSNDATARGWRTPTLNEACATVLTRLRTKAALTEATPDPSEAGLAQSQLAKRIGIQGYTEISKFERIKRTTNALLAYSRLDEITLESIVDDDLEF